ncbi:Hypothetical_protein [Hexamita inflata]|uniref:Hypothetical_protein n=1 Tax=Hexamita inflata TaxID=28002 RepID=A0AA86RIP8_9EUKA|nr:Hypothetical protein HINF_LOCUS66290 [Hexamita inflata]
MFESQYIIKAQSAVLFVSPMWKYFIFVNSDEIIFSGHINIENNLNIYYQANSFISQVGRQVPRQIRQVGRSGTYLNLMNPVYIHEYIQYGYYANAIAMLIIFPLTISYIEFCEKSTFELLILARKLLELYLNDLDVKGAVQFNQAEQEQLMKKTRKLQIFVSS